MYESIWSPSDMHWVIRTSTYHELLGVRSDFESAIECLCTARYEAETFDFKCLCLRGVNYGLVQQARRKLAKQRKRNRRKK